MTRMGDAPEGGTSYKYANPNYPQEGITLPSTEDGAPPLFERLRQKHLRDFHGHGGACTSPSCAWFAMRAHMGADGEWHR